MHTPNTGLDLVWEAKFHEQNDKILLIRFNAINQDMLSWADLALQKHLTYYNLINNHNQNNKKKKKKEKKNHTSVNP